MEIISYGFRLIFSVAVEKKVISCSAAAFNIVIATTASNFGNIIIIKIIL